MVDRTARLRALTWLLSAYVLAAGCSPREGMVAALAVGNAAPDALKPARLTAVRVTWVFGAADLVRCRDSAIELRHLQARFGSRVEVATVALDTDPSAVESFLRYNRVRASVRHMSKQAGNGGVAGLRWPALYIVKEDTIRAVYTGAPRDDARSMAERDVESTVSSLLGRSGTAGSTAGSHFSRSQ